MSDYYGPEGRIFDVDEREVAIMTCNQSTADKHTCLLPADHDGPHRCGVKLCGKAWPS